MKDFYDVWILSKSGVFEGDRLARAIAATFVRRKTDLPEGLPRALTAEFADEPAKRVQWTAFAADVMGTSPSLEVVCRDLAEFLAPHIARARSLT
jgi:hypothetical protein